MPFFKQGLVPAGLFLLAAVDLVQPLEQGHWEIWDPSLVRVTVGGEHRDMVIKRGTLYAPNEEGVIELFQWMSGTPSFINVSPEEFEP